MRYYRNITSKGYIKNAAFQNKNSEKPIKNILVEYERVHIFENCAPAMTVYI